MHQIGTGLAKRFLGQQTLNKVVLNVSDHLGSPNNCGFNLTNFKPKFVRDFFNDIVHDYERSFVGSFASALMDGLQPTEDEYGRKEPSQIELYVTVAKFSNTVGYTLTQNTAEELQ